MKVRTMLGKGTAVRGRKKTALRQPTVRDVINEQLMLAHKIHPGYLMAGAVVNALSEAGYTIMSDEQLAAEIALAHQAGYEEAAESVGCPR